MSIHASRRAAYSALPFAVCVHPHRETIHVTPAGELDMATVGELRRAVQALVDAGFADLVIDLRALVFLDCVGLELLFGLDREARRDGWHLSLIQGGPAVLRLLTITETLDALPFLPQ